MGCNCKVNQKIDYIHKKYGDDLPKNKKTNIRGNVSAMLENLLINIAILPLYPFIGIYLIFKLIEGTPIHMDKIVKKV